MVIIDVEVSSLALTQQLPRVQRMKRVHRQPPHLFPPPAQDSVGRGQDDEDMRTVDLRPFQAWICLPYRKYFPQNLSEEAPHLPPWTLNSNICSMKI